MRLTNSLLVLLLLWAAPSDAAWLKPGDSGRLFAPARCGVTRSWLEDTSTNDPTRVITLPAGTHVHDLGFVVIPGHQAATYLKVISGEYHGAKCWVSGPAPKVRSGDRGRPSMPTRMQRLQAWLMPAIGCLAVTMAVKRLARDEKHSAPGGI